MIPGHDQIAPLLLSELIDAIDFVSASQFDEHQAYICTRTGRIFCVADGMDDDDDDELPDDPEADGYIAVPHRRDLNLGKSLALKFVAEELPALLGEARDIFRRKGAFRRFKHLIEARGELEKWYAYEEHATGAAVRNWCRDVGITLIGDTATATQEEVSAEPMTGILCDQCDSAVPPFEITHAGSMETGYRNLCSRCFNEEVARQSGLPFDHIAFQPVELSDARGERHRFHFVLRHLGTMLTLGALEIKGGECAGYEFHVHGAADADPFILMQRLLERMRRELSNTYLVEGELGLGISGTTVRGQISCDPEAADRLPVLVIDGREVSWDQFGHMLMTFEGWRINLEIEDPSDEV